ncbi:hypothetical protein LJR034_005182 [Caballeronia sp. LjRoot34]|uniref:hypothetical protein n=1 Tax=Caballeronia sp. LjRoot34 TaxID=3342325 RepID=UPI003ECD28C2
MSRSVSLNTHRPHVGRRFLNKTMLLPVPRQVVDDFALANHLALAACRQGSGNAYLVNELLRVVYISYFLGQRGVGRKPARTYREAEAGLERTLARAKQENVWHVDEEVATILEQVLTIYDEQLDSAATWMLLEAKDRLDQFLASDGRTPILGDELSI